MQHSFKNCVLVGAQMLNLDARRILIIYISLDLNLVCDFLFEPILNGNCANCPSDRTHNRISCGKLDTVCL